MQKFITASEQQTEQLAEKLAATLCGTEIIAMYGDLGAGKTAFWSENIKEYLPEERIDITIKRLSENEREITVEGAVPI